MKDEVIVITPEIQPGEGGLADHTRHLLEEWNLPRVRVLVPRPKAAAPAEVMGSNAAALFRQLPARGGRVFLQYSAYGFNHWGYPRWLLRALFDWKLASAGRLVLMLHETWARWPWWNKNYPIQQLHRRALIRLARVADAVFTTTARQAAQLQKENPSQPVRVLPVGSNIRPNHDSSAPRQAGVAVLFGRQATRLRTLCAMETHLRNLAAAGALTKLISVGQTGSSHGAEKQILEALGLREGFDDRGPQPDRDISALLWSAGFGLSEMDALNIPKSGVFMAFAAHGLNVLSPLAGPDQPEPLCWAVHPAELRSGLSADELTARAAHLRAWYESTASWSRAAAAFAEALEIGEATPAA